MIVLICILDGTELSCDQNTQYKQNMIRHPWYILVQIIMEFFDVYEGYKFIISNMFNLVILEIKNRNVV